MAKQQLYGWAFIVAGLTLLACLGEWNFLTILVPVSLLSGLLTLRFPALTRLAKKG